MTLVLLLGFAAEAAHFSIRQGRSIICADSVQYVDGAEAILTPGQTANFGYRKPGYSLVLAAVALLVGNMGWGAVAANSAFQALLPVAAYGLGRQLRSRLTGWIAAILVIAQLQASYWAERIMAEPVFTLLLSCGLLVCAVGLSRLRPYGWMLLAGGLLGLAWLMRPTALAAVAAAVLCAAWCSRSCWRRAAGAAACLMLPVALAGGVECGLNLAYSVHFCPSSGAHGTGVALAARVRHLQGAPFPDTESGRRCLALLPERSADAAYAANITDFWVARYRAIRDQGLDDWAVGDLFLRAGWDLVAANPQAYLSTGARVFIRHVLRQKRGSSVSEVPESRRLSVLVHPAARDDADFQENWFAYWALPHRSLEESAALVSRMRAASDGKAPFGQTGVWAALRYWSMLPPVVDAMGVLRTVGSLWPGFALLLCPVLGLNRRTCALLALSYVFDGVVIAAFGSTEEANERCQSVWLAADSTLAAAMVAPLVAEAATRVRALLGGKEKGKGSGQLFRNPADFG